MKNKLSKGLSLSANPKCLIKGIFSAATDVFASFFRKNDVCENNKHSTKLAGGTKQAILGPVPRILLQQGTNLVNKFALLLHKCRFAQDSRDKPENDGSCRCWLSICCSFFNYPSPADKSATDKPSKEGLLYFSICLTRGRYNKRGADNTTSIDKPNACIRCRCVGRPLGQTIKFVLLALFAWCSTLYAGAKRTAHYCFYCLLRGIKVLPLVATGGEVLNNITFKGLDVVRQYAALLERRVQSSTRVRKFLADGVQYGRSMIEMLGVLAIIGVLSVAGIAGYSKAMTKWKINKTIEQIEHITHGIFTAYANQKKMDTLYTSGIGCEESINLLKSLGILSEDMILDDNEIKDEYDNRLKNPFGGDLWLGAGLFTVSYPGHSGEKGVDFEYYNIPREACMALGSLDWSKGSASVIGVGVSPNTNDAKANASECWLANFLTLDYGDWLLVCNTGVPGENSEQTEDDRIPLPIPLDIVAEHCNCKDNDCYFSVSFTDK